MDIEIYDEIVDFEEPRPICPACHSMDIRVIEALLCFNNVEQWDPEHEGIPGEVGDIAEDWDSAIFVGIECEVCNLIGLHPQYRDSMIALGWAGDGARTIADFYSETRGEDTADW